MPETKRKTCFLVSPIGEEGSEVRVKANDFRDYIIKGCDAIREYSYDVIRADDINEPGRITSQIMRKIVECELVIVDVTGWNSNVYYEMAIRHAIGKPIIVCAEIGTILPFDTRDNRTIFYSMHSRIADQARKQLSEQIKIIDSGAFTPDSPVSEAQQVISISGQGGGENSALAEMMESINSIGGRIGAIEQILSRFGTNPTNTYNLNSKENALLKSFIESTWGMTDLVAAKKLAEEHNSLMRSIKVSGLRKKDNE